MKLNDRVWCTASAQQLYDYGYGDRESTFMLHTYGQIKAELKDRLMVSYAMWCQFDKGHQPVVVFCPRDWFKFADLDEDYIQESEGDLPEMNRRALDILP